jgi:hypothetical protein
MTDEPFWTIQCSKEQFERLVQAPELAALTSLARCVNALRFAAASFPHRGEDSPGDRGQRLNALMCQIGFLHESYETLGKLGRSLRHFESFGSLTSTRKSVNFRLVEAAMRELRNTSVFHFDERQSQTALRSFTQDPCVFASGRGDTGRECYYELADVAAMQAFIGETGSTQDWLARQRQLALAAAQLTSEFVVAAERLLAEGLYALGFAMVESEEHPHSDGA